MQIAAPGRTSKNFSLKGEKCTVVRISLVFSFCFFYSSIFLLFNGVYTFGTTASFRCLFLFGFDTLQYNHEPPMDLTLFPVPLHGRNWRTWGLSVTLGLKVSSCAALFLGLLSITLFPVHLKYSLGSMTH